MKKFVVLSLAILLTLTMFMGCSKENDRIPEYTPEENELLVDPFFTQGFDVTAFNANESKGEPIGSLRYGGEALGDKSIWRMAQWGCTKNLMDAAFKKDKFKYTYDDGGKKVAIDCSNGNIGLGIDGDVEFGGAIRQPNQDWPHLLIEQGGLNSGKLSELDKLYLEIEFTMSEYENQMDIMDMKDYHSAQFQWFVTLQNGNPESANYNRSMWFGLGFFDRRHDYPPQFAAQDGGKEDNTGMFIFIVDSKKYLQEPVKVGNKVIVKYDILPQVKNALYVAKMRNFLSETNFEDLQLGSTNIGWEITGNFKANVDIEKLSITKVPKSL